MLWERAKNLMLLFFLLLNMVLGYFLYQENNRYSLSLEQERAINRVLNQHKISLYKKINRQYPPMRPLLVASYHYDTEELLSQLFTDPTLVSPVETGEADKIYFEYENQWLVISNGYVSYNNPDGLDTLLKGFSEPSQEGAAALCGVFIHRYYPDYQLDSVIINEDGSRFCYRQVYQDYMMYANFIEFLVTDKGITQIDIQYGEIQGFGRLASEICAPDEALLAFAQYIRVIYGDMPVVINDMDIVYDQEEFSTQEGITLTATPYYRIFVENQDIPFMVNAYTNNIR